jgi:hypothetical protein
VGGLRGWGRRFRTDFAANVRGEISQVDKLVGLTAQFIRDCGTIVLERRDDRDAFAMPLKRRNKVTEGAVAREENNVVGRLGKLQSINCEFDAHVRVDLLAAVRAGADPSRFGDECKTIVVQPVHQWFDGCVLILHDHGRIIERPDKMAAALEKSFQLSKVDLDANRTGNAVEIRAVDEENGAFIGVEVQGGEPYSVW